MVEVSSREPEELMYSSSEGYSSSDGEEERPGLRSAVVVQRPVKQQHKLSPYSDEPKWVEKRAESPPPAKKEIDPILTRTGKSRPLENTLHT